MGIDLLCSSVLIKGDKPMQEILASQIIVVATVVIREIVTERRVREFLCE